MIDQAITVSVDTEYLGQQAAPDEHRFAFAYHITIHNQSAEPAQLLARHWIITDSNEVEQVVRGMGVIGQQPLIGAGQSYQYSSGVVLDTPIGTMQGHYKMIDQQGESFEVPIKPFLLSTPNTVN
jgi:ApaG protein